MQLFSAKNRPSMKRFLLVILLVLFMTSFALASIQQADSLADDSTSANLAAVNDEADFHENADDILNAYCSKCHNDERWSGGWSLSMININDIAQGRDSESWEGILRVTSRGEMPPADKPQLSPEEQQAFTHWLETALDEYSAAHPNPGRATLRRLNRAEYSSAVKDLLAMDVDIRNALPGDDSGYGFDNNADVLTVSTTLMERYISVAGKLSRLAVGITSPIATTTSYTVPKDGPVKNQGVPAYNFRMSDDLPIDSRGGGSFDFYAPHTGTYEISGFLNANTNNEVDRLVENRYSQKVSLKAGTHNIGMAFRKQLALDEAVQNPKKGNTDIVVLPNQPPSMMTLDFIVDGARVGNTQVPSYHMSSRFSQLNYLRDVMQIDITGPLEVTGVTDTPSRKKIFSCTPLATIESEYQCAEEIISRLARQAYRRPVNNEDIAPLLALFDQARSDTDFEHSIATAIQALMVSPNFLYLYEQDPDYAEPGVVHTISDLEFAARLALFLWSSLPDQELLDLAENNQLRKPEVLEKQITRMLGSPKAEALTTNFAGQWLYLRNLEYQFPDVFEFPEFDVPLRQAMQRESELFFHRIVSDNQSVYDFLNADYSYLNERLARHYGIDGVKGTAFRKVALKPGDNRGGLLGQASILTVTSYANHTSPVKRGKWILDNLLAATPAPPPPDIPSLIAEHNGVQLTAREQMALHREDPTCASCHLRMDPFGLSLEKYDAVGAFRERDAGQLIDASAVMPDGTEFDGLTGLQDILLARKQQFAEAFIERMLTYALGRGLEAYDQPIIRSISRASRPDDYRLHSIILAIASSQPFNLRRVPEA